MLAAFAFIALSIFFVMTAFPVVMVFKRLRNEGVWMPLSARVVGYIWGLFGVPADIGYNVFCGTWQFRQAPKELMFTHRVQRLATSGSEWRREKALQWAAYLNAVDPGHIKL